MKIRLRYQGMGKYQHWIMELWHDTPAFDVKVKMLYHSYTHPSYPPPPAVTVPDAVSLTRTARAAAEIQAR